MPTLTGLDGNDFLENAVNKTPQIIDADVTLTDDEGDWSGGTVVVGGLLAEDRIAIKAAGSIAFNKTTGVVKYNGVVVGTATGGVGGDFTITFNANATTAAVEAVIEHITYANVSDTPNESRTLTLIVTDAAGNTQATNGPPDLVQQTGCDNPFEGVSVDGPAKPLLFDYDDDGDLDLLVGTGDGTMRGWENVDGAFIERTGEDNPAEGLDVGDDAAPIVVDGGDFPMLLIGAADGRLYTPGFGDGLESIGICVGGYAAPAFGNPFGEGGLFLIVGNGDGTLRTFLLSDGILELTGENNPFACIDVGSRSAPALGDVDKDGDIDLVVGSEDSVRYWRNDNGAFTEITGAANPFAGVVAAGACPTFGIALADLNGDCMLDLLTGDRFGNLAFYLSTPGAGQQIAIGVEAEVDRILGTAGGDDLTGTAGPDILEGLAGDDELQGGKGDDELKGGAGADVLRGGKGDDRLDGGIGADDMDGGEGNDSYVIDNVGDVANDSGCSEDAAVSRVSWTMGAGIETLTLLSAGGAIDGTGNCDANGINGNGSANTLSGMGGDDLMYGANGNDQLYGGDGDDRLHGDAGHDLLDGGDGADDMWGGAGNDTYVVDDECDDVTEDAAAGTDIVKASVDFTLGDNVENLDLTGWCDIDGTGNGLRNTITGNGGDNTLNGGGEVDTLSGDCGDDRLNGDAGNDVLDGGDDDDVLSGGIGSDRLTGGSGADVFRFTDQDLAAVAVEKDQILDLDFACGDVIDLSCIDANTATIEDDAFSFVTKFTKTAGQAVLKYVAATNLTTLELDVDGDGKADFRVAITGNHAGTTGDLSTGAGDGGWVL